MKRIICTILVLILTSASFGFADAGFDRLSYLADTDGHWAENYIDNLFDMGIFMGDSDGARAEDAISRGEFTALITRALYDVDNVSDGDYFPDVKKSDFFYKNAAAAAQNGIIKGDEYGNFNGEKSITREEIVIIISRVLADKDVSKKADFKDISSKYLYISELEKVYGLGIISGDENKKFNPHKNAMRAECAKMIYLTLENYGKSDPATSVLQAAEKYVLSGTGLMACGAEEDEKMYKSQVEAYARSLGYSAEKTLQNIRLDSYEVKNSVASALFSYDVSFNSKYGDGEEKRRNYNGKTDIKLMRKNGKWTVYKTYESLKLDKKVNLTWEIYNTAPTYAPSGVNVISPTWYEIIADNSYKNAVTVYSDKAKTLKITDKASSEYLDYARKNGYNIWTAYRNNFNAADTDIFLKSDSARNAAVRLLISGIVSTKADGINIDFENMNDKYAFTNHVREVSLAMRSLGFITSVDINKYDKTGGSWSMCYDRDKIGQYADYTAVMAYDQNGSWSKTSGPVAGLNWVEDVIKTTLGEVDAEKLILGVPLYVRIWREKDGKVVKTSAVSMDFASKTAAQNNAKIRYDSLIGQNVYTWSADGYDYTVYMEDEVSIANKIALVKKYSLAGAASWRRGFESAGIWTVIKDGL